MTDWTAQPDHPTLGLSRSGSAARLELRRPDQLNAIDTAMIRALLGTLRDLAADDSVRAVLVTGSGRAFSAGADVGTQFDDEAERATVAQLMRDVVSPAILTIRTMPKPVVAAVNGPAAGLGCSLALACDLVVAAESASFLLAFAKLGLTLDGGASVFVPARVGLGRALRMSLLAERVSAADALTWGLADQVVPDADLAEATNELVTRLSNGPTRSYAASKALLNRTVLSGLAEQLDRETDLQAELLGSRDFSEGISAFADRRPPRFTGA